jgi:hypothetical protein
MATRQPPSQTSNPSDALRNTPATAKQTRAAVSGSKRQKKAQKTNGQAGGAGKLKIFWAVFNASYEAVALFAYADLAKAKKKAAHLTATLQVPHFVQKVKRYVTETGGTS